MTSTPVLEEAVENTIKRDVLGRVVTPRRKREALLDEFDRSGMSAAAFARQSGLNYTISN